MQYKNTYHKFFPLLFLAILFFIANTLVASAHIRGSAEIQMDENGFNPGAIQVIQGDTVIFRNTGTTDHWPASNIHPTHQIYPEFDPKRGLAPGESWSFEFDRAGTWKMHDHLYPGFTGQIEVKEDTDFVPAQGAQSSASGTIAIFQTKISSLLEQFKNWLVGLYFKIFPSKLAKATSALNMFEIAKDKEKLIYWLGLIGPEKVMEKLLRDSGNGAALDCHQPAHQIGRAAYELFGADAFKRGSPACHSGFYHGAMEAFLREKGTQNLSANISAICKTFDTRFGIFECLHGIGHGILAYEDYNLPEALKLCKTLGDSFAEESCYGGLFMENIVTAQGLGANPDHKTAWVSNDPHFPCDKIDQSDDVQVQCYQMQTSWMLTLFQNDFAKVSAECLRTPANMIAVCFSSLGRDAAGNTLRIPEKIMAICAGIKQAPYFDQCVRGALNVIVDFWGGDLQNQAIDLCKIVPEEHKQFCYVTLAERLQDIFSENAKRNTMCRNFEPNYQNLCDAH